MIQRLRTGHRRALFALALIGPLVIGVGMATRAPLPALNATLPGSDQPFEADALEIHSDTIALANGHVAVRLFAQRKDGTRRHVSLQPKPGPATKAADVLVYWLTTPASADSLPASAVLLGPLAGARTRQFELPKGSGELRFYSLAEQRLLIGRWAPPSATIQR